MTLPKRIGTMDINRDARIAITYAIDDDMAVSELEPLGLSTRTIGVLEEQLGIIYIKDLIRHTKQEILDAPNMGIGGVMEIEDALNDLPALNDDMRGNHLSGLQDNFHRDQIKKAYQERGEEE